MQCGCDEAMSELNWNGIGCLHAMAFRQVDPGSNKKVGELDSIGWKDACPGVYSCSSLRRNQKRMGRP